MISHPHSLSGPPSALMHLHSSLLSLVCCLFVLLPTRLVFARNEIDRVLHLRKTAAEITIDGRVEPAWQFADSATTFFQLAPYYSQPPTQKTVAKILTTDEALYCMITCYQPPATIVSHTGLLDQFSGDAVSIMLDTFNDHKTAYKFAVSASGVRGDSRMLDDARDRDYTWDGVWSGDSRVYDWGFVVEMRIPYTTLKYAPEAAEWGLDFDRWIASGSEDLYWCTYEQNEGQRVSKFGRLVFDGFRPATSGLNLEVYPVGYARATYNGATYAIDPRAGIDMFYNPSEQLTFQLTANPDFAQIEADPFQFNISRYESYFPERRPFFTEGNEIFMASGRQQNSGFYRPLELFYSRRIGKALPDGNAVPLLFGAKASGRLSDWEYGGFVARTAGEAFTDNGEEFVEPPATFGSVRLKTRLFENSSIGALVVAKTTSSGTAGVLDVDGAFRTSAWQLSYQLARSFVNGSGDYGISAGFLMGGMHWVTGLRIRAIGKGFEVNQVGFVPWTGTTEAVGLTGPKWYYDNGYIKEITLFVGGIALYEDIDLYTDRGAVLGFNMQLRDNWGYEVNLDQGDAKDNGTRYRFRDATLNSWCNISPSWNGNVGLGYSHTYNFARDFVGDYMWLEARIGWIALATLELGTSFGMYVEKRPEGALEEITYNARPYFSLTPFNNLNVRMYADNLFLHSTQRLEHLMLGLLFSYNFLPKSWIYLAINEVQDRSEQTDPQGGILPPQLHVTDRAAVFKVRYLHCF